MSDSENFTDLQHWKPVMEFTVEQAALLCAGIDPWEVETTQAAKEEFHPRWKQAATHSLAIVAAIRQGLISPVICRGWQEQGYDKWLMTIKHTDREIEICPLNTIITRASLENWIANHAVPIHRPRRQVAPIPAVSATQASPVTIDAVPEPLALPYHGHQSEGLELVEEAVKQFWATFDEEDPATAPTKEEVTQYLESKGATGRMAGAVDMILRPFALRTRGLKSKRPATRED